MNKRVVAVAVVCLFLGAIIGPPVVNAATQLVTIKGAGTNSKAKVTGQGQLKIHTESVEFIPGFLTTLSFTTPNGVVPFAQGSASQVVPAEFGVLTNAVVDLPTGQGTVTVTLADQFGEIWQGTVDGGNRHLNDTFDSGLIWEGNLQVTVSGTGAEFTLDGIVIGGAQSRESQARHKALSEFRRMAEDRI